MKNIYVITGATGGMGKDIAKTINPKGINILVDLDEQKLIDLQKELKKLKVDAIPFACDITDKSRIAELIELVKDTGTFKALIHTAGVSGAMASVKRIFEINLIGTQLLLDAFYEIADQSTIIVISSMSGHLVPDSKLYNNTLLNPLNPKFLKKMNFFARTPDHAYAFSKKGVNLLITKEVERWAFKNSRIVSISPGVIETPMLETEKKEKVQIGIMLDKIPVRRVGYPKDITGAVEFLCSDKASYITGTDILIDGGITALMKHNNIFK